MISYGKGPLGRVYERLRKRSYRRLRSGTLTSVCCSSCQHEGYVTGVRDALDAVRSGIEGL